MRFTIKNRYTNSVMFEVEADSFFKAVEQKAQQKAILSEANLSWANLSWVNLSWVNLSWVNLSGANLSGANLSGANLTGADLSWVNLSGAILTGADLTGANLSGANLSGANLSGANLTGADLTGVNLSGANLTGAKGLTKYQTTPLLMLLDQPGDITAYKLTKANGEGPYNGGIVFGVGKSYSVADANTNEYEQCGAGINVATLDWCLREYRQGYRIFLVEFTSKDIACIPPNTDGKFRLHRCKVIKELNPSDYLPKEEDSHAHHP